MTRRSLLLIAACILAALPASAQDAGSTAFTLIAEFQDGQYVWVNPAGEVNPTLVVPPSTEVAIVITQGASSLGVPHNIQVGGANVSDQIVDEGDSLTYTFISPPSGEVNYVCTIHPTTMEGVVRVAGADGGEEEAGEDETPGVGLLGVGAALLGAHLLARRRGR